MDQLDRDFVATYRTLGAQYAAGCDGEAFKRNFGGVLGTRACARCNARINAEGFWRSLEHTKDLHGNTCPNKVLDGH